MQKQFLLGDSWVYFKVYASSYTLMELVPNIIYKLANKLTTKKLIYKYFFVKYNDSNGQHVRMRLQQTSQNNIGAIIELINLYFSKYIRSGLITNLSYDIYSRELDRYTVSYIEEFEFISFISSKLILSQVVKKDNDNYLKIICTSVKIMDEFLNYLDFSTIDKYNIYESYYKQYEQEFNISHKIKSQLSDKYKKYGNEFEMILNSGLQYIGTLNYSHRNSLIEILRRISISYKEAKQNIYPILLSIIHLHYNRTFVNHPRENELVLYFILSRVYKTQTFKK